MILYLKDHKDSTKKFPISNKCLQQHIRIQKSVAFLFTNNDQAEKEIWKIIPFTTALKNT
jgi:hypothetical protein